MDPIRVDTSKTTVTRNNNPHQVHSTTTNPNQPNRQSSSPEKRIYQQGLIDIYTKAAGEVESEPKGYAGAHFDRNSAYVGAEGKVSSKIEGSYNVGRRIDSDKSTEVGVVARMNYEMNGEATLMANKEGAYLSAGAGSNLSIEGGLRKTSKAGDASVQREVGVSVSKTTEASAKIGASTSRQGHEIVSREGLYAAARVQVNTGVYAATEYSSNEGKISGKLSLQGGVGIGGGIGLFSEARIDTNNWNVKFATTADLDIGAILDFGITIQLEGQTNIAQEISQLRNELIQQLKEQENKAVQNQNQKNLDKNKLRQQILQNIPNWNSKISTIKQGVKQKIKNILTGFAKNTNEKIRNKIEEYASKTDKNSNQLLRAWNTITTSIAKAGVNIASRAIDITGHIVSRILYLLFPRIETAINEIKPTDVLKG